MSWYKDIAQPTYVWRFRAPISVDATAVQTAKDVSITIPADWDGFWDYVRSAGEDVRVCTADGKTLVVFDLQSFNATTRTCTIEVQSFTPSAAGVCRLWLYWGQASCSTGLTVFAIGGSPYNGYIDLTAPRAPMVRASRERAGETKARSTFTKRNDEVETIWFDFTALLRDRSDAYGGRYELEEINYAAVSVSDDDVAVATAFTAANTRHRGRGWVGVEVKAGVSGTTYTVRCEVTTISGGSHPTRTLRAHTRMFVQNLTE